MMDFNGLAELGGYDHKHAYGRFYSTFLTTHQKKLKFPKLYVWKVVYAKQPFLDVLLDIVKVCREKRENPIQRASDFTLVKGVMEHRKEVKYYLSNKLNFDWYKHQDEEGYYQERYPGAKEGKATKGKKKVKETQDKQSQSSTHRENVIPLWYKFCKKWERSFIIAEPEIPLLGEAWYQPFQRYNSHVMLTTHGSNNGSTIGNIGVIPGAGEEFAQMMLEQLHLLVLWDGSRQNGSRRIEFLTQENPLINNPLQALHQELGRACQSLLPDLLPGQEYVYKVVGEASLCPAPALHTLTAEYEWSYSQPKAPSNDFLNELARHQIFAFWGFYPLTKDGMFVNIYPPGFGSKLVFVPPEKVLLCPIQVPCLDGLRTSITGSPGCKFCIYLLPNTLNQDTVRDLFVVCNTASNNAFDQAILADLGKLVGF
jgi:hypothetical protein